MSLTDIIRHHKKVENKKCHQQILFAHFLMFFSRLFCLRVSARLGGSTGITQTSNCARRIKNKKEHLKEKKTRMERRVTIDHAVANAKVEVGASTATSTTSATASATTTADQPQPALGIKCEGCDDFSCTSAMAESTKLRGSCSKQTCPTNTGGRKRRYAQPMARAHCG